MNAGDLDPNPVLDAIEPPTDSEALRPDPQGLLAGTPVSLATLRRLAGRSLLGVGDLERETVIELARLACILESVEITPYAPLRGKLVITAFFEASTRTRTSFESATLRLDGKVISIPDGQITGARKGERLEDIGEMFNAYGDLVVFRHGETDSIDRLRRNLRIPIINAGNGTGEHPTQALADWYALLKWRPDFAREEPRLDPIHLGILGTPGSMRAVKSFLLMALKFRAHIGHITLVSEMADPVGEEIAAMLRSSGIAYEVVNDLAAHLPHFDVIYMNSIAFIGDSYRSLDASFKLDAGSPLKPSAVVLHPLARLDELDPSLDDTFHNLYWAQAHGAVFLRQALFIALFNRLGQLPENIPVR